MSSESLGRRSMPIPNPGPHGAGVGQAVPNPSEIIAYDQSTPKSSATKQVAHSPEVEKAEANWLRSGNGPIGFVPEILRGLLNGLGHVLRLPVQKLASFRELASFRNRGAELERQVVLKLPPPSHHLGRTRRDEGPGDSSGKVRRPTGSPRSDPERRSLVPRRRDPRRVVV